jgi:hypothetical protein
MKTSVGVSYAVMLRKINWVNCWNPYVKSRAISSQANQGWLEGSETRGSNLGQKKPPRAPSTSIIRGEDIVLPLCKQGLKG